MSYSEEELEKFRQAGRIAKEAREYGKGLIKIGASLKEVSDLIEKKIIELGAGLAFPVQISRNYTAAHYCSSPNDESVFLEGDLVKLDLGTHIDGYIADTAVSIDLGGHEKLIQASRDALDAALKTVRPGVTVSEIGEKIAEAITSHGYVPVINLSGHGLARWVVHTRPQIPNFESGDKTMIEEGMVFAIEPFASDGKGTVVEGDEADIFQVDERKPVRSPIARKVLSEVLKYNGLPFTTRWLTKKFPHFQVSFALNELAKNEIIRIFPPLNDQAKGMVSQAEHTVIVTKEGCEVTTR